MANQLTMDKSLAINNLRAAGYSERRIAQALGVSRGAVPRHLQAQKANSTKAPTGSGNEPVSVEPVTEPVSSASQCEPFREIIISKCDVGLSAKRIHQDLVANHGFEGKYWSVNRFVKFLGANNELPFRRMEVEPGEELQVDFGMGAKIRSPKGTYRRTHVFRCVLSYSRKGYTEAVFKQDTESFIRALGRAERTAKLIRRHPIVAGLTAAVVLALIGGTIVSSFFAVRAQHAADAESVARADAEEKRHLAERNEQLALDEGKRAERNAAAELRTKKRLLPPATTRRDSN